MRVAQIGEFGLIEKIKKGALFNKRRVIKGIGDDAAVEKINGNMYLLSTCDMLVENIHFLKNEITPWQLGYKAAAVNLSDIAAMGGRPTGILVSIAIPKDTEGEYIEDFYKGLKSICKEYETNLLGGDTVSSLQGIVVSVTALGEVLPENLLLRSGAQVGDLVMVTGTLGDSAAGLEIILQKKDGSRFSELFSRHLTPSPQVKEGMFLASLGIVTAMNDISDGLASEITEIAEASRVGAKIIAEQIPLSQETKELSQEINKNPLDWALYGGEDYQLVFTCPEQESASIQKLFRNKFKRELYEVGSIVPLKNGISLEERGCPEPLIKKGYNHF